jgi:hypothetical protein
LFEAPGRENAPAGTEIAHIIKIILAKRKKLCNVEKTNGRHGKGVTRFCLPIFSTRQE